MSLLRNVLAGIGSYLVKEGELNEQAARDDLLFRRQVALEQVKEQYLERASARDHTERLDEITTTAAENRRTAMVEGVIKSRTDEASDNRDLQKALTLKKVDLANDEKMEKLRASLGIQKSQWDSMLTQAREDHAANSQIDHWAVDNSGALVGYSKGGKKIGRTGEGAFPVPVPGGSDPFDGYLPPTPSSARTAPQATPAGIAPVAPSQPPGSIMSQLSRLPPPPDGKVGRTMTGPNGMKASWNGKVWVLADVNGGQ
jgi:hypothetical protein